ncbi:MAG: hypothetical protein JSV95_12885 [Gemmatimonadota bacterium]|nr:MAG: hypothetical protein JSV95_12885 [Gemmatimonadota bacterium]
MADEPTFSVDAFLEGDRLRRGVELRVGEGALTYDDLVLSLDEVFWTSRRAGLLLVFATGYTVAFRASEERLDELARTIDGKVDGGGLRRALLETLEGESIVCHGGVAASGKVGGNDVGEPSRAVRGLHVAVFTRQALHLFARQDAIRVPWPMEVARETEDAARPDRPFLELQGSGAALRLLYLRPEERTAVLAVAGQAPSGSADREEAIEMFARREVAGPTPARLPEFNTSAETIRVHAEREAARLPDDLRQRALLDGDFFANHFRELGETALGPLLFRKSAASRARSLAKAVEAMDAGALQDDARAASLNSLGRLAEGYGRELRRLLQGKRRAQRLEERLRLSDALRESLQGRFLAPVHDLAPQLQRLERAQADLIVRLERLEEGPPEAEETELDAAAEEWHGALVLVDRDFESAWGELLAEIGQVWADNLLPGLVEAAAAPRQRVPEWIKLLMIGLITLLVVATAVLVLLR